MIGGVARRKAVNFQTIPPKNFVKGCERMLLFCSTSNGRVVVPLNRVYNIVASSCTIIINYDCGDLVWLDGDRYEKKVESVSVTLDSPDEVDKVFRQFYKACNSGSNAFYFG